MFMRIACVSLLCTNINFASEPAPSSSAATTMQKKLERNESYAIICFEKEADLWKKQKNVLKEGAQRHTNLDISWYGQHVLVHATGNADTQFMNLLFAHGVKKPVDYDVARNCLLTAQKPKIAHYVVKHLGGADVIKKEGQCIVSSAIYSHLNLANSAAWRGGVPQGQLFGMSQVIRYYLSLGIIEPTAQVAKEVQRAYQIVQQQKGSEDPMGIKLEIENLRRVLSSHKNDLKLIAQKKQERGQKEEIKRIYNAKKKAERKLATQQKKSDAFEAKYVGQGNSAQNNSRTNRLL